MFPFPRLMRTKIPEDPGPEPGLHEEYIAMASQTDTKIAARDGDVFTDLGSVPYTSWQPAWHPTLSLVAIGLNVSPYLVIYDLTSGTPVEVTAGPNLPAAEVRAARWSPDGQYLALSLRSSPWIQVRRFVGGVFTKLTDPASLPGAESRAIAWSADSTRIIYVKTATGVPGYHLYSVSGTVVTRISTFTGSTTSFAVDIARDAGETIVGGDGLSPYAHGFAFGTDKNTVAASGIDPPKPSAVACTSVAFNKDGTLIAVVTAAGVTISTWDGSTYTSIHTITASGITEVGWTGNDILMAGRASSPWIYMAKVVAGVATNLTPDSGIFDSNIRSPKGSLVP